MIHRHTFAQRSIENCYVHQCQLVLVAYKRFRIASQHGFFDFSFSLALAVFFLKLSYPLIHNTIIALCEIEENDDDDDDRKQEVIYYYVNHHNWLTFNSILHQMNFFSSIRQTDRHKYHQFSVVVPEE